VTKHVEISLNALIDRAAGATCRTAQRQVVEGQTVQGLDGPSSPESVDNMLDDL